ncbi:MAG: efflux transporter outer membrane subunit [Gemmatimonadales bacterium]
MRKAGIFLSLAMAVAGCATAPGYRAPEVQVPTAFRETRDTIIETLVPGPAVPDTLSWPDLGDSTLTRLLKDALGANLDVRAAEARVRGARAARTEAVLDFAPTVTFAGGYTRQRLSGATFPIGAGTFPDQDIWDGGFDAFWELDLFGRVRRNVQARGAFLAVTQEDQRDIQVSLAAELARAYFELRGAQEQLSVAQRNGENQRRTLQVTRQRLDAGRGTAFDTERAQAQLSLTLASIPVLESRVRQAQYQIGVLVGRPPAALAAELEPVAALPTLPPPIWVASPDSVVRQRPDVAAAERQLAVERALVGAAKADYLPRITVGGSAGYSATTFGSLGDRGTFRYAVGPIISWPALNLGRVKARVDFSRAREAEARAQYDQTVLRALQDVETALVRYRTSRARVARIQDAAAASERAAELARVRFSGGVSDFLQVLDAERTQLDAQDQLAQGRTEAATAYAALYKALGGTLP